MYFWDTGKNQSVTYVKGFHSIKSLYATVQKLLNTGENKRSNKSTIPLINLEHRFHYNSLEDNAGDKIDKSIKLIGNAARENGEKYGGVLFSYGPRNEF
jgi:hypothetical protein